MEFTKEFEESVENNDSYKEALEIVKQNSSAGKIWAAGGIVFRGIVSKLYGIKNKSLYDFDFMIEKNLDKHIIPPKEWKLIKTHFGDPRLVQGEKQIDIWPINHAVDLSDKKRVDEMTTEEKLESYFKQVPLTIQAIVYDINDKKIVGEGAITAIKNKEIKVNEIRECLKFCKARKISVRKFMRDKARDLNFEAFYPTFDNERIKKETEEFYDVYSEEYETQRGGNFEEFMGKNVLDETTFFIENLKGKKVLDLGCGTGRDALFLKKNGLTPVCVDISSEMVAICKKKGLEAYKKDMENLDVEDGSFDGVWAYTSLLHIPKDRIYNSLARISEILKEDGLLFLGMVEGNAEKIYRSQDKSAKSRFFALYKDDELRKIINDYFEILKYKRFETSWGESYLVYVCRKLV